MSLRHKSARLIAVFSIAGATLLTGCSDFSLSDDAKDQGLKTICNGSQMAIEQLDSGDDAAKFGAILIRDNTENSKIKKMASKVADGDGTRAERQELIKYIKDECDKD